MSLKVNLYNPKGQAYASRIRNEDWEKHRNIISHLHASKIPRKVMLSKLRDEYNFTPTLGQLQAKCKDWNLKVYSKEGTCKVAKPSVQDMSATSTQTTAFHLAAESGFVEEWSDDYRVHPSAAANTYAVDDANGSSNFQDISLPPEYIGGGLLANTADSHWPIPKDLQQCEAFRDAAHFYYSVNAFQQAFSIYRAIYLYQCQTNPVCHPKLVITILQNCSAATTDHQRNIMHSLLREVGSSRDIDKLDPFLIECLQAASLSMVSSDSTCDVESAELVKARAITYLHISTSQFRKDTSSGMSIDLQAMLYEFEQTLQTLLNWCESTIDRLHRDLGDIFVGHTTCEEEYYRRVAQVLSSHLLKQWHKRVKTYDRATEMQARFLELLEGIPCAFQFHAATTQALVALAFVVVDTVRQDPLVAQLNKNGDASSMMWLLDAYKLFKRSIRMLYGLSDRARCDVFAEAFLERFYASVSSRQKAYRWSIQLPAIVDFIGMSMAQQNAWLMSSPALDAETPEVELSEQEPPPSGISAPIIAEPCEVHHGALSTEGNIPDLQEDIVISMTFRSTLSESDSITSFMKTYHRSLNHRVNTSSRSGKTTPGDLMSLTSSADFKFGLLSSNNTVSEEVDSVW